MLSINTNLSSLIAQNSLKSSTLKLNTAVERMTTGYKINHAKDNAANYSIVTNMSTKLGAYQVAEDNVSMGLDFLASAADTLDLIGDKLSRLRALSEQAANGTYGQSSLSAINAEANAIMDEIQRIKKSAEVNGKKLFGSSPIENGTVGADESQIKQLTPNSTGFLQDVVSVDTSSMTKLSSISENASLTSGTYSISTPEELAQLRLMVNSGKIGANTTFVLANDIDLSKYSSGEGWSPIGTWDAEFQGTFDGNGFVIKNLYIKSDAHLLHGLFGSANNAEIKNVGIASGNIDGYLCGAVVAQAENSNITNCFSNIDIASIFSGGGLIGIMKGNVSYCYATGDVKDKASSVDVSIQRIGGLIGQAGYGKVEYCYAEGNVTSHFINVIGGLIGYGYKNLSLTNCYATGDVKTTASNGCAAGLVSITEPNLNVKDCYTTGDIFGLGNAGGLIASFDGYSIVTNSYSTGDIIGDNHAGGIFGQGSGKGGFTITITNCHATGNIKAKDAAGGLFGRAGNPTIKISDSYAAGDISGGAYAGGVLGYEDWNGACAYTNCHTVGKISSNGSAGILTGTCGSNAKFSDCTYNGVLNKGLNYSGTGNINSENIVDVTASSNIALQVGINADTNSQINFNTFMVFVGLDSALKSGIENLRLEKIDSYINEVSSKQVEFGSIQNRLESALDEIATQQDNLVSSRSTLRDADVAQVSSEYIKQQILQQASATLLATANQAPALALQLL